MGKVLIRFYEELNDFLPPSRRKRDFEVPLNRKETVQDIIKRVGVPQEQVDLVLVNGQSAPLDRVLGEGDRISVYPVFERFNIRGVSRVREKPLRGLTFVVDSNLKPLAQALERLGLDTRLCEDFGGEQALKAANKERRIFLTLQGDLPGPEKLDRMILLKPGSLRELVRQVVDALDLEVGAEEDNDRDGQRRRDASEV